MKWKKQRPKKRKIVESDTSDEDFSFSTNEENHNSIVANDNKDVSRNFLILKDKDFVSLKSASEEAEEQIQVGQIVTDIDENVFEIEFLQKKEGKNIQFVFPLIPNK